MQLLDLTLATPEANLACDEMLLDLCEGGFCEGVLRFWESPEYFVVLGYANKAATEVDLDACHRLGIPILRRCSGGGAVVQGRGCLNYSLVLRIDGTLQSITQTNCQVMQRNRDALRAMLSMIYEKNQILGTLSPLSPLRGDGENQNVRSPVAGNVEVRGHTDLALDKLKFSGNSQRRRRDFLLFHGSFLLNFDLSLITELLKFPSKEPDYRQGRSHGEFLTNLPLSPLAVKLALQNEWQVATLMTEVLQPRIDQLVAERYSRQEWNFKW